jgi:hypothetical protein
VQRLIVGKLASSFDQQSSHRAFLQMTAGTQSLVALMGAFACGTPTSGIQMGLLTL